MLQTQTGLFLTPPPYPIQKSFQPPPLKETFRFSLLSWWRSLLHSPQPFFFSSLFSLPLKKNSSFFDSDKIFPTKKKMLLPFSSSPTIGSSPRSALTSPLTIQGANLVHSRIVCPPPLSPLPHWERPDLLTTPSLPSRKTPFTSLHSERPPRFPSFF